MYSVQCTVYSVQCTVNCPTSILSFRTLRIGLTVPEMDIAGLYRINGEVFILPLEGGGSFTTKMSSVKVTGQSLIYSVINPEGRKVRAVDTHLIYLLSNLLLQLLQVSNFNVDFGIGHVFIQLNNLFNGENKLLADTVNKFLNDHSQEVIKEVREPGELSSASHLIVLLGQT